MSLNIKVLHLRTSQVFYPGDQVSGHVVATGPIKDENTSVVIVFFGRSKVILNFDGQKLPYSDSHMYFSFTKTLFRGPCNIEEGSSAAWPFKFELPLVPRGSRLEISDGKETEQSRFSLTPHVQMETTMPPIFSIKGNTELQRSKTLARTRRAKGGIPVTLCRPKVQVEDASDPKAKTHIRSFEHSSSRLQAGREEQSRSFRQWTKDSFTKKTPHIYFRVSARVPTQPVQGQEIPIQLGLTVEQSRTTASPPLQFKVMTARYDFKALTALSATCMWSKDTAEPSELIFSCPLNIEPAETIWRGDDAPLEIKRKVLPPKSKIVPSFRAKFIERSYFAKLVVEVEIGGKLFEAKFPRLPVTLLTSEVEAPGEGEKIVAGLDKEPSMTVIGAREGVEWGLEALKAVSAAVQIVQWRASTALNSIVEALH